MNGLKCLYLSVAIVPDLFAAVVMEPGDAVPLNKGAHPGNLQMAIALKVVSEPPRIPTILVVEDEALLRVTLSHFLQECGFNVLEAVSADEAVQILDQSGIAIDLVLSDVRMPGSMDGFGLATWIRKNRPGLPVFLASGDDKKVVAAKELCAGEPFFAKPYDLDHLVMRIRKILGKAKENGE
jgi:CheY-like chemotaxis protein